MSTPAQRRARFGTDEPVPRVRVLQAGALRCEFAAGAIRAVHWRGTEVLRGVAWLLRDTDWGTVPARVGALRVQADGAGFVLRTTLRLQHEGATLRAQLLLQGRADGQLQLQVQAVADRPLRTNRCGLVLLHPADCAGRPLRVRHRARTGQAAPADSDTTFPLLIQPAQPVFDIAALQWSPAAGVQADCSLQAELPGPQGLFDAPFEMEDQRNWSDASFKTYVGSLHDPWPYTLPAGVSLCQSLTLELRATQAPAAAPPLTAPAAALLLKAPAAAPLRVAAQPLPGAMPPLGIGMPHLDAGPDEAEQQAVAALRPAWLVVEVDLSRSDAVTQLQAAQTLAQRSGAQLQLDAIVPDALSPDDGAGRLATACAAAACTPAGVRLCPAAYLKSYQPSDTWPAVAALEDYAAAAARAFAQARIGGGMLTFFTELNRQRQSARGIAFIGHATCPTVHASDDASVMQSLQSLPHIAATVRAVWPGLGWRLGPSCIATRRNPYGAAVAANPRLQRLTLAEADPRHHARFGAAWCAAYALVAAPLAPELLALLHTHGPNGPLGVRSRPEATAPVPAWLLLRWLAQRRGAALHAIDGLPSGVLGLGLRDRGADTLRLLLVNTGERSVVLPLGQRMRRVSLDDAAARNTRTLQALRLQPYDFACLRQA